MRAQRYCIQLFVSLFVALPLASTSYALTAGPSMLQAAPQAAPAATLGYRATRDTILSSFEQTVGKRFTPSERNQIHSLADTMEIVKSRPQSVAWNAGTFDWSVIACLQGKLAAQNILPLQALREIARASGGTFEGQICIDVSTWQYFVLLGGSVAANPGPDILTGGFQIGLYFGSAHINKPIVGTYWFVRATKNFHAFKGSLTFAYDKNHCQMKNIKEFTLSGDCQVLVFFGASMDVSGWLKSYFKPTLLMPTGDTTPAGLLSRITQWLAGVELSIGALVSIDELKW